MITHLNAVVFLLGLGLTTAGVATWSLPTAGIVAGVILMLAAAWPGLHQTRTE